MDIIRSVVPIEQRRLKVMLVAMGVNFTIFVLAILLKDPRPFADLGSG